MNIRHHTATVILFAAAFFGPAEAADRGETLFLALFWMLWLGVYAIRGKWRSDSTAWRCTADLGLLLLAVGHLFSTWSVLQRGGDQRAAVTMSLEWLGLGAAWLLLIQLAAARGGRILLTETILAIAVGLACHGYWQCLVERAADVAWYEQLREELDSLEAEMGGRLNPRTAEIRAELRRQGVPLSGTGRAMFENRLVYSTEPTGPFALANTLAGILAVGVVLGAGCLVSAGPGLWNRLLLFSGVLLTSGCLLLTKSRSAWLGAIVGLALLLQLRKGFLRGPIRKTRLAAFALLLAGGVAAGGLGGLLDKEVILESPRSLGFRLMYWSGTLQMLAEQPLLGVGPGNFREHYLPFRWAESSEEIRDPHNLFLDAWSSAGLLGLSGLTMLVTVLVRQGLAVAADRSGTGFATVSGGNSRRTWWILVAGLLVVLGKDWLHGGEPGERWSDLALTAGGVLVLLRRPAGSLTLNSRTAGAAGCALVVHLLAAGGLEVPAVMLLLLALTALTVSTVAEGRMSSDTESRVGQPGGRWGIACISLLAAAGTFRFGMLPLERSTLLQNQAVLLMPEERLVSDTELKRVRELLLQAIEADPLSPGAHQLLAALETQQLQQLCVQADVAGGESEQVEQSAASIETQLEAALAACDSLTEVQPFAAMGYRLRGTACAAAAEATGRSSLQAEAERGLRAAISRNPVDVRGWLQLASFLSRASDVAAAEQAALRALEINEVNQRWGHRDRELREEEVVELQRIGSVSR